MQKRSLIIANHSTSIALEPEFWLALEQMAKTKNLRLVQLISKIDTERTTNNLTSALRVAALDFYYQSIEN